MSECSVVTSPLTRSLALVCASAGCVVMLSSCSTGTATPRAEAALVERSQVSMGTEIHLSAWTTDEAAAVAAFARVFLEFDRLDALMSVWKEGSDILRLNAAAGKSAVAVSPDGNLLVTGTEVQTARRSFRDFRSSTIARSRSTIVLARHHSHVRACR